MLFQWEKIVDFSTFSAKTGSKIFSSKIIFGCARSQKKIYLLLSSPTQPNPTTWRAEKFKILGFGNFLLLLGEKSCVCRADRSRAKLQQKNSCRVVPVRAIFEPIATNYRFRKSFGTFVKIAFLVYRYLCLLCSFNKLIQCFISYWGAINLALIETGFTVFYSELFTLVGNREL